MDNYQWVNNSSSIQDLVGASEMVNEDVSSVSELQEKMRYV